MQFTILGSDLKRLVSARGRVYRLVLVVSAGSISANGVVIPVSDSRDGAALIYYRVANALAAIGKLFSNEQLTFTRSTFTSFVELPRSGICVPQTASCIHLAVGDSEFNLRADFGELQQDLGEDWILHLEPRMAVYIDIADGVGRIYQKTGSGAKEKTLLRFHSRLACPNINGWRTLSKSNQLINQSLSIRHGYLFLGEAVASINPEEAEKSIRNALSKPPKSVKPAKPAKLKPVKIFKPRTKSVYKKRLIKGVELLSAGRSVKEVAQLTGAPQNTVCRWRRSLNLKSVKRPKPPKPMKSSEAVHRFSKGIKLLEAGHSAKEVAEMTSAHVTTVYGWRRKLNQSDGHIQDRRRKGTELLLVGHSVTEVAEMTSAHVTTVYGWKKKLALMGKT